MDLDGFNNCYLRIGFGERCMVHMNQLSSPNVSEVLVFRGDGISRSLSYS